MRKDLAKDDTFLVKEAWTGIPALKKLSLLTYRHCKLEYSQTIQLDIQGPKSSK